MGQSALNCPSDRSDTLIVNSMPRRDAARWPQPRPEPLQILRFVPGLESGSRPICDIQQTLFDHLVGLRQQYLRHSDTDRLRSLEVHDELELRRLLDRQIGWFSTL
jgi:hypothetical protein